jgi:hypothetical protein
MWLQVEPPGSEREIFLACIPGSYTEGGTPNLNEDGAGGSRFSILEAGTGGIQSAGEGPEQDREEMQGSFSRVTWRP